jgi:predicted phage baseplate assembly protein
VPEADLRFDRDPATGTAVAAWVRWHERPHLYDSSVADRHFVIERATGLLRFGARVPAAGTQIIASYATGGGAAGNVPANTVRELRTALPYIAGVDNPIAAAGGASAETTNDIETRGPQILRHRDRALSAQDYEWLARGASPEVARTRCEPLRGPDGRAQRGWITVLVAPRSAAPFPSPSPELARRIRQAVAERAPATVALRIEAPDYVAVSVLATLAPEDPSVSAAVEARVRDALTRFLHPLTGGPDGAGWAFGESVHLSQIARVIETTPGVDYATRIMLACGDALYDTSVPVPSNMLIAAGNHELTLRTGGE